jgi:5-hydroxyisourate hydrolase
VREHVITTHVLDLAAGRPAAGVEVVLELASEDGWSEVTRCRTDGDGRARELGPAPGPGRYRLRFDTAGYLGPEAFFPEVTVQFAVEAVEQDLHVPLLLSPFGYSTYRGS